MTDLSTYLHTYDAGVLEDAEALAEVDAIHDQAEELAERARFVDDPERAARMRSEADALVRSAALKTADLEG